MCVNYKPYGLGVMQNNQRKQDMADIKVTDFNIYVNKDFKDKNRLTSNM